MVLCFRVPSHQARWHGPSDDRLNRLLGPGQADQQGGVATTFQRARATCLHSLPGIALPRFSPQVTQPTIHHPVWKQQLADDNLIRISRLAVTPSLGLGVYLQNKAAPSGTPFKIRPPKPLDAATSLSHQLSSRTPVPDVIPKPAQILQSWKPASFVANRHAASVAAYLVFDKPSDFNGAAHVWQGLGTTFTIVKLLDIDIEH